MAEKQPRAPTAQTPVPAPESEQGASAREAALLAEISQLKAALERHKAASGQYTPATPAASYPAGPLKPYMVSLDHVHKGLVTPSKWFEHEKPGDPRGQPIMATSEAHAKAVFEELHGIKGYFGAQPPEIREMTAEELEQGDWGPPPQPGPKREQRMPEKPKRQPREPRTEEERQQAGMVRNRAAQVDALQF